MAEKNDNWFSSWLSAAKNKSTEVLEFVKKDLEEFGTAVKNEASSVVSTTGSVIEKTLKLDSPDSTASSMKKSFSTFLGQVNTVLNPSPDDSDTEAVIIVEGNETVQLTKLQEAIYKLQINDKTFLTDPDGNYSQQYECWLDILEDQMTESSLIKHLNSSVTLNNQYMKLVPEKVSHNLFWQRYLFKKAIIEDDMARQEALERKKSKEKQQPDTAPITQDDSKWDLPHNKNPEFTEDFASNLELTEEEQIRLLEQYENETKQRNVQKEEGDAGKRTKSLLEEGIEGGAKGLNRRVSDLKLPKTESNASLEIASTSSSSSDGDWEKIGYEK